MDKISDYSQTIKGSRRAGGVGGGGKQSSADHTGGWMRRADGRRDLASSRHVVFSSLQAITFSCIPAEIACPRPRSPRFERLFKPAQ
eukprot:scaffold11158_cov73-Isochrysis_galbana.AAC.1